jgi:hypothetical protein
MTTPPEANTEYSRATQAFPPTARRRPGVLARPAGAVAALAVLGALLLVAAELAPLYSVHVVTSGRPAGTVSAGAHDSYALLPLALLAAVLAVVSSGAGGRQLHAAIAGLGLIALLIALLGDLPDAHAHGLTRHFVLAATTPGVGLYLETGGGVALLAAGGTGLLLAWPRLGRPATATAAPAAGTTQSGS